MNCTTKILLLGFLWFVHISEAMENADTTSITTMQWYEQVKKSAQVYYEIDNKYQQAKNDIHLTTDAVTIIEQQKVDAWKQLQKIVGDPNAIRYAPMVNWSGIRDEIAEYYKDHNDHTMKVLNIVMDYGDYNSIRALLACGANPNDALLAVHLPIFIPHTLSVARLLTEYGAYAHKKDGSGRNVVFRLIARKSPVELIEYYLKDRGVNVNEPCLWGSIPLHGLISKIHDYKGSHERQEYKQKINLLLQYGASINVRDDFGETPLNQLCKIKKAIGSLFFIREITSLLQDKK